MVSLDNLKTAISAIKSEISSISSRYLKKTDAYNTYITKKNANSVFATKSSIPKILGFDVDNPDSTYNIRSLEFPHSVGDYDVALGLIQHGDYSDGSLRMAGYKDVQYAFSADLIDGILDSDLGGLDSGATGLRYLKSGESVTGVFAKDEDSLVRAKRAALSSTGQEFSTPRDTQGIIYHDVSVDGLIFRLISTNRDRSRYPHLADRLYDLVSTQYGLFYFISDEITEDTAVSIPFTITRIDGKQPEEYDCIINTKRLGGKFSNIGVGASRYESLKTKLTSILRDDTGIRVRVDMYLYNSSGTSRYVQIAPSSVEYQEDTQNIILTYYGYGNTSDIYTPGWFKFTIDSSGIVSGPVAL